MGYKEKIQLLEDNLAKLDNELKSVKTVVQSSIESAFMLMENSDHDLADLSNKIEEYGIKAKEAIKEGDREKAKKLLEESTQLQSETVIFRQKTKPTNLMVKKYLSQRLDEYRLQSVMIRQISILASDYLDSKILELEKLFRKFGEYVDKWVTGSAEPEEGKRLAGEIRTIEDLVHQTVTVARDCIKSTIEKFKD